MRTNFVIATGASSGHFGSSEIDCRRLYDPQNIRTQRIRSIASVFPQFLIFPRRPIEAACAPPIQAERSSSNV